MKLQAKQRLLSSFNYPKLLDLVTSIARLKYKLKVTSVRSIAGIEGLAFQAAAKIGQSQTSKAELFLKSADEGVCKMALQGKCPSKDVNAFVSAFCSAFDDLYN